MTPDCKYRDLKAAPCPGALERGRVRTRDRVSRFRRRPGLRRSVPVVLPVRGEAAQRLGVTRPRLNDLLNGKISKFSLDALVGLAQRAGINVTIAAEKV